MSLTIADFAGFKLEATQRYLSSFDAQTRRKGEDYFRGGAVAAVECHQPGRIYTATVLGNFQYQVTLHYDGGWGSECTCPMAVECKHAYAALKQLLAEYSSASVADLSATAGKSFPPLKPVVRRTPPAPPASLADTVREKLDRKLTADESRFLKTVTQLFRQAQNGGLHYISQLALLGVSQSSGYWERLELYPSLPRDEVEFWNYLALYFAEKLHKPIPDFLEAVTDLTDVRDRMHRHQRGKDIERWKLTLARLGEPAITTNTTPDNAGPVELRLRFAPQQIFFEWRTAEGNWELIRPRKLRDFEDNYSARLTAEGALLWMPYWQRTQNIYGTTLNYNDPWMGGQIIRWLRQSVLRPLFVSADGEPLVFHDAPLRWQVTQPEHTDGDYALALLQADGTPLPEIWLTSPAPPMLYLTPLGVFNGPPFDQNLMSLHDATLIPAKAFESAGGLRLLDRLQAEPPPRLAARVRTVKLHPGIRAEVKAPWAGQQTEYCYVDVFGVSEDGEQVEGWMGTGWVSKNSPAKPNAKEFTRLDRSALGALIPPLDDARFKWDYQQQRWQLRLTKKFAETFVPLDRKSVV